MTISQQPLVLWRRSRRQNLIHFVAYKFCMGHFCIRAKLKKWTARWKLTLFDYLSDYIFCKIYRHHGWPLGEHVQKNNKKRKLLVSTRDILFWNNGIFHSGIFWNFWYSLFLTSVDSPCPICHQYYCFLLGIWFVCHCFCLVSHFW